MLHKVSHYCDYIWGEVTHLMMVCLRWSVSTCRVGLDARHSPLYTIVCELSPALHRGVLVTTAYNGMRQSINPCRLCTESEFCVSKLQKDESISIVEWVY